MPIVKIQNIGQFGVNSDLSQHELPPNAWTDAKDVRFLDGYASQYLGHGEIYASPAYAPQHVIACNVGAYGYRYWIYTTATKTYCVTSSSGPTVHTDITHATPRNGVVNQWTSTLLSGIPILNSGIDGGVTFNVPMSWDLDTSHKFVDLVNWPANTYCRSIRAFKNYLVAMNIVRPSGTHCPFMVKWSHPADPGSLPSSWDITDATKEAGEVDLAEGTDPIIDGLQLRGSFIIYKESSIWRMDHVGGTYVFNFTKVLGNSGAMNSNCIAEIDGYHVVLTGSDVIIHDGQTATSILDKATRRTLFSAIDPASSSLCFVFTNPYFNEVFIAYPSAGSSVCDMAMVWNYRDKTVSFRTLPGVNHAATGAVDKSASSWSTDTDTWDVDVSTWNQTDIPAQAQRVIMASSAIKLYLLDSTSSYDGSIPSAYIERRGLSFGAPEKIKLVRSIRPRISGNDGQTVIVKVGSADDPYDTPTYTSMTHTIGSTVSDDCLVSGRYISIRFETGTAYGWRLDSYDIDITESGAW